MNELQKDFTEWFFSGDWVDDGECYRGVNTEEGRVVNKENAYRYAINRLID